jgi:hypothetical protein
MKRFLTMLAVTGGLALTLVAGGAAPVHAQTGSGSYPSVSNLRPFSPEANYMSLPGYLRYLVYQRDGVWMSRQEAVAVVDQQIATGP